MWLSVSTHSHPKVAAHNHNKLIALFKFQHTATRRWLQPTTGEPKRQKKFQHTATRRWLHLPLSMDCLNKHVSTHSHPKVAATAALHTHIITKFQHTATRRWLLSKTAFSSHFCEVSTHSHPKVAAGTIIQFASNALFQHTATRRWLHPLAFLLDYCAKFQHTATRRWLQPDIELQIQALAVSTHSHPKVAARKQGLYSPSTNVSTHSHPKVAAGGKPSFYIVVETFQHTATRRWLPGVGAYLWQKQNGFNTQPPEGGCRFLNIVGIAFISFNTQPPEGGCKWTT